MFPGMNSRQAQQMMRRMGINQQELDATEVIIKFPDKKLVFSNPSISKVNMGGNETYQLSGESQEMPLEEEKLEISEDDIKTVVDQTNASKEDAKKAIEEKNGDLAEAILKLSE